MTGYKYTLKKKNYTLTVIYFVYLNNSIVHIIKVILLNYLHFKKFEFPLI